MLDALRQVIHLRAYAQRKPIDEYKHEAFQLFERMLAAIREDVTRPKVRVTTRLRPVIRAIRSTGGVGASGCAEGNAAATSATVGSGAPSSASAFTIPAP